MGRRGLFLQSARLPSSDPLTTPQPIGRRHAASARRMRTVLGRAWSRSLRGLVRKVPDRRVPGPCLIAMAMLEFTRAGQCANHGRRGEGEPLAGNRRYGIGVVEVMGLQMIPARLVGLIVGGGRVSWRLGVPGAAFGVIFLAIGGGFRPRGGLGRPGYGGPNHRCTSAVTPGKPVAAVASP